MSIIRPGSGAVTDRAAETLAAAGAASRPFARPRAVPSGRPPVRVILVTRNAARKPTTTGAIKRAARRTGGRLSRAAGHQARGTRPRRRARRHRLTSLGRPRLDGLENLLLHGLEVEAGSFLQRRELDEPLADPSHPLLHPSGT